MSSFVCVNTPRSVARARFLAMKNAVLGRRFRASLVFVSPRRARALNRTYRKKSYVPNVLAFRLAENEGDIFICTAVAAREAWHEGVSTKSRIAYLFIHGLLHLKGFAHGATMERQEKTFLKKYHLSPVLLHGKTLMRD